MEEILLCPRELRLTVFFHSLDFFFGFNFKNFFLEFIIFLWKWSLRKTKKNYRSNVIPILNNHYRREFRSYADLSYAEALNLALQYGYRNFLLNKFQLVIEIFLI